MPKNLIFFLLIFLLFAKTSYAQTPDSPVSTVSGRNKLTLLENPQNGYASFLRFSQRITELIKRIKIINSRISNRAEKLNIDPVGLKKISSQIEAVGGSVTEMEKTTSNFASAWQIIIKNNDREEYLQFKKDTEAVISKLEKAIKDQKTILKELKKYKLKKNG